MSNNPLLNAFNRFKSGGSSGSTPSNAMFRSGYNPPSSGSFDNANVFNEFTRSQSQNAQSSQNAQNAQNASALRFNTGFTQNTSPGFGADQNSQAFGNSTDRTSNSAFGAGQSSQPFGESAGFALASNSATFGSTRNMGNTGSFGSGKAKPSGVSGFVFSAATKSDSSDVEMSPAAPSSSASSFGAESSSKSGGSNLFTQQSSSIFGGSLSSFATDLATFPSGDGGVSGAVPGSSGSTTPGAAPPSMLGSGNAAPSAFSLFNKAESQNAKNKPSKGPFAGLGISNAPGQSGFATFNKFESPGNSKSLAFKSGENPQNPQNPQPSQQGPLAQQSQRTNTVFSMGPRAPLIKAHFGATFGSGPAQKDETRSQESRAKAQNLPRNATENPRKEGENDGESKSGEKGQPRPKGKSFEASNFGSGDLFSASISAPASTKSILEEIESTAPFDFKFGFGASKHSEVKPLSEAERARQQKEINKMCDFVDNISLNEEVVEERVDSEGCEPAEDFESVEVGGETFRRWEVREFSAKEFSIVPLVPPVPEMKNAEY